MKLFKCIYKTAQLKLPVGVEMFIICGGEICCFFEPNLKVDFGGRSGVAGADLFQEK